MRLCLSQSVKASQHDVCDRVSPLTYTQQRFEKSLSYFPSAAGGRFLKTAEDQLSSAAARLLEPG
jgi:hypothetical protein